MGIVFSAFWIIVGIIWFIYHIIKDYDLTPRNIKRAKEMAKQTAQPGEKLAAVLLYLTPIVCIALVMIGSSLDGTAHLVLLIIALIIMLAYAIMIICTMIGCWLDKNAEEEEKRKNEPRELR